MSSSGSASKSPSPSGSPSPSPSPEIPENDYTREQNGDLPLTTTDLSTLYTTLEENDVYAHDDVFVSQVGNAGAYMIHQFKKTNTNRTDLIKILVVLKSSLSPTDSPVYLQIWNGTTLSWETIDSMILEDANAVFGLESSVGVNNSNYYDFGNQIAVRVYQLNNSAVQKSLSVDQVNITFETGYDSQYEDTGNQYSQMYPEIVVPEYSKIYPSSNPQNDL